MTTTIEPVSQKSTDEILGVIGYVTVIREGEGISVVHDFAVGAHQGVCIKRCVT